MGEVEEDKAPPVWKLSPVNRAFLDFELAVTSDDHSA
jgi:hypothetical protein